MRNERNNKTKKKINPIVLVGAIALAIFTFIVVSF